MKTNLNIHQVSQKYRNSMGALRHIEDAHFNTGDVLSVKVYNSKTKKKKQSYVGVCIAKKNRGLNSSFTIRTVLDNDGVEYTFPLYSPLINKLQVLYSRNNSKGRTFRRSKLYYLRNLSNKSLQLIGIKYKQLH